MKRGVVLVFLVLLLLCTSFVLGANNTTNNSNPFAINSWGDDLGDADSFDVMAFNDDSFATDPLLASGFMPDIDIDKIIRRLVIAGIILVVLVLMIIVDFIMFFVLSAKIKKLKHALHSVVPASPIQSTVQPAMAVSTQTKPSVSPELSKYVQACQTAGTPRAQLEQILQGQGYDQATINLALQKYVPHHA